MIMVLFGFNPIFSRSNLKQKSAVFILFHINGKTRKLSAWSIAKTVNEPRSGADGNHS